jgi:AbrB family looped-hinge helix DNA binding protein
MSTATVSQKYQIVIPKEIRAAVPFRPGQKVHVIAKSGYVTIVPDRPLSWFKGFAKGIDTENLRDKTDRF